VYGEREAARKRGRRSPAARRLVRLARGALLFHAASLSLFLPLHSRLFSRLSSPPLLSPACSRAPLATQLRGVLRTGRDPRDKPVRRYKARDISPRSLLSSSHRLSSCGVHLKVTHQDAIPAAPSSLQRAVFARHGALHPVKPIQRFSNAVLHIFSSSSFPSRSLRHARFTLYLSQ